MNSVNSAVSDQDFIANLTKREREVLACRLEGLTVGETAARLSISQATVRRHMTGGIRRLAERAQAAALQGRLEAMVEAMLPDAVPSPAEAWHAQQNAQARVELLRNIGALTAEQVADLAGSTAGNRSALASRWHSEGRIIGVPWHGRTLYPAFQFRDGRPNPVVERAAEILRRRGLHGWQLALWFTTPTGWLWDRAPIDLLEEEPERVLAAAEEALSLPA